MTPRSLPAAAKPQVLIGPLPTPTRPASTIVIAGRTRSDMGDLDGLAQSINDVGGLLMPIAVKPNGELIAGHRRLLAWQRSDFKDQPIPVHYVDVDAIASGAKIAEYTENIARKDFTWAERCSLWLEVEPALKEAARKRQREHGGTAPGRAAEAPSDAGRLRDQMAKVSGRGGKSMEKAVAIYKAWQADPVRYGLVLGDMNRNGVNGAYNRFRNMQAVERIRAEPPPLPMSGPYRTIAIDPPWEADLKRSGRDPGTRGYYPYPTMSLDDICALPIEDIIHPEGTALWLWVPNFHLANGLHVKVLDAWGFAPSSTILTWAKTDIGLGQRLRGASEHCVLAVRGKVPLNAGAEKTWFEAPGSGEHSEKPAEFFEKVERVTPAPRYAMLFAGATVPPLWDGHGDRIGKTRLADQETTS